MEQPSSSPEPKPQSSPPGPAFEPVLAAVASLSYWQRWRLWWRLSRVQGRDTLWDTWWKRVLTAWLLGHAVGFFCPRLPLIPSGLCEQIHEWVGALGR